jgi:5'(3')-deoxyribonucleotidase
MRSIICLDVDGILRPFIERTAEVFGTAHDMAIELYNGEKDFYEYFIPYDKAYVRKFIFEDRVKDIFLNAKPYPEAEDGFSFLQEFCNKTDRELMIVSSQFSYTTKILTLRWLERFNMLTENLAFVKHPNKFIIDGNILIDDERDNLQKWSEKGKTAICFDRAWNKDWKGLRLNNLTQIPELLNKPNNFI